MRKLLRHLYILLSCEVAVALRERVVDLWVMRRLRLHEMVSRCYVRVIRKVYDIRHFLLGVS